MNVGETIKSLRMAAGLKQRELADRLGVSNAMLSLVEAGKRDPTIPMLRDISRELDLPASILFAVALDGSDDKRRSSGSRQADRLTKQLFEAARGLLLLKQSSRTGKRSRSRNGRRAQ